MKRYYILVCLLCLMVVLSGCKEKDKEFVMGDKELIHLTSTPRGEVETYEIYTTNIMIYVDGTVRIYASDFVKWLGDGEIPVTTLKLSPEEIKEIENLIISNNLYNLREDVGNKDGISGTVKHMTIYGAKGTNTTGGISVSNRQFVRAYDRIEGLVKEDLYIYLNAIEELQYKGYQRYLKRNVEILDRDGKVILDYESINNVYTHSQEDAEGMRYYTVIEYNQYGGETLYSVTSIATKEKPDIFTLHISGNFETNIVVEERIRDSKIYIPGESEEQANQLTEKIKENIR